jgi:prolyl-tRNA editing enzyme YbaK/EbsC (Cys-tRNA(Pro) deacylase)
MSEQLGSVARVRAALLAAGHPDTIMEFPASTRTAADAAAAVGCTVAQIAKSIVFRPIGDQAGRAVVIITSGANRVDPAKAAAALGVKLARADADWVRATTGFAIGGVAPIGHITAPVLLLDEDLLALDPIWAAAGTPTNVFQTTPAELRRITGAPVADVRVAEARAADIRQT